MEFFSPLGISRETSLDGETRNHVLAATALIPLNGTRFFFLTYQNGTIFVNAGSYVIWAITCMKSPSLAHLTLDRLV